MESHLFAREARAYDISDILTDIIFKDERGNQVTVRMLKAEAIPFMEQLQKTLEKTPVNGSRYGWSSDPQTDRELQSKYGTSIYKRP